MAQNEELEDMEEMVIDQGWYRNCANCGTELERLEAEGDIARRITWKSFGYCQG